MNNAIIEPGTKVEGTYHGTPFSGVVSQADMGWHGGICIDVPAGWTHNGRPMDGVYFSYECTSPANWPKAAS